MINNLQVWKYQTTAPIFSSPCVSANLVQSQGASNDLTELVIFGSHDKHVYCLSAVNGKLKWKQKLAAEVYSSPFSVQVSRCDHEGHTACVPAKALVIAASTTGMLYMLDIETGRVLAEYLLPHEVFSSPVAVGNTVVIGCRDNFLYCFDFLRSNHSS